MHLFPQHEISSRLIKVMSTRSPFGIFNQKLSTVHLSCGLQIQPASMHVPPESHRIFVSDAREWG